MLKIGKILFQQIKIMAHLNGLRFGGYLKFLINIGNMFFDGIVADEKFVTNVSVVISVDE